MRSRAVVLRRFIPWLVSRYRAGTLPIDRLVTRHYPLDRYNDALRALEAGGLARGVLDVTPA
jgi:Zn-dependent alcohol dehydrogenase